MFESWILNLISTSENQLWAKLCVKEKSAKVCEIKLPWCHNMNQIQQKRIRFLKIWLHTILKNLVKFEKKKNMEAPIYRPSGGTPSKGKITTGNYNDVIMSAMASHIASLTIVYSIVYSSADQRIHQSFASLPSVWGIHRWPVHFPHKGPVTRNIFSIWWRHHGIHLTKYQ